MFIKCAIVLASVSAVLAGPYITAPTGATTANGGDTLTVKWQEDSTTPALGTFGPSYVWVATGNAKQQTMLITCDDDVDVSKVNSVDCKIDATIGPSGDDYFVRIQSKSAKDASSGYPYMTFSSKFNLANMSGTFNSSVQAQIAGQSTAPIGGSTTASGTATGSASGSMVTTKASAAASGSSKASGVSASGSAKPTSAAMALEGSIGLAGALLSAVIGVALF